MYMCKKYTKKQKKYTKKKYTKKTKKYTIGGTSPRSNIKSIIEKVKDMNIKTKSSLDAMRILQEKRKINFEKLKTKINSRDKLQKEESNVVDLLKNELSAYKNELDLCKTDLEKYKKSTTLSSDDYIDIEPFIQPYYDLGTALQESEPYYDLGTEIEEQPYYDLGTAIEEQPYYDLGTADDLALNATQMKTFVSLVKEILVLNNITNKDELDKYSEGVGRKKLYKEIKDICLQKLPINKCNNKHFNSMVRGTYQTFLQGYKRYNPIKK